MSTRTRLTARSALAALVAATTLVVAGAASTAVAADQTESVAHRGDKQHYPDNSLAGIASAVAKGADWIEIDVQYNPSGDTFFLSHDNSCSGPGGSASIDSATYATVVARCALPELADVLTGYAAQGYTSFIVELKTTSTTAAAAPAELVSEIGAAGVANDVWISCIDDSVLAAVKATGTTIDLMRVRSFTGPFDVSSSYITQTAALGYDAINVNVGAWSQAKVDQAASLGLVTVGWAWPTADEGDNTTAIGFGLDMFMTDRLDDLHAQLGR